MEITDSLWVEKYRPRKFENLVLPDSYKQEFEIYFKKKEIGNLLFSGPPGSGKTTLARIICSKNGVVQHNKDNVLSVNGSAKKTRNIGFVDSVVEPFLKIPPLGGDKYKIVFIDEIDYFTADGFHSLRGIIEKYQEKYGRFIVTCNYVSKIPDAIQSRFTPYIFQQIPKSFVLDYCKKILEFEKIKYDEKSIQLIINNLYPDVRKVVNSLHRSSLTGKLIVDEKTLITTEKVIFSSVVEIISAIEKEEKHRIGKAVNAIIEILSKHDIEFRSIYTNLFFMKNLPVPAKIIVNKYSNSHQNCLVPHMHFMGMIFEIIKSLQEYKRMLTK